MKTQKSGVKEEKPVPGTRKSKPKLDPNISCAYCGKQYINHLTQKPMPMPVYILARAVFGKKAQIYVCHSESFKSSGGTPGWREVFECRKKALADGYEFRPDLGVSS